MSKLIEPLTKQEEDKIFSDLGYSREQLKKDLEYLRDWLQKQHHLPPSRLNESDEFLQMFLTGTKGSLETAKRKLDNYYTYRSFSELFENRDPIISGYSEVTNNCYVGIMPQISKQAERIVYINLTCPDPEKYDFVLQVRRFVDIMDIKLRMEGLSTSHLVVMNMKCGTPGHVLRVKPTIVRDFIRIIQDIYPFRISNIIFINTPSVMDILFNKLVIPFLSKKLKNRVLVTSKGHEILSKYIDKSLIAKDFDGDNLSLKDLSDAWSRKIFGNREWFLNELSERTDESKRVDLNSYTDSYFGVHGSLKKLVID